MKMIHLWAEEAKFGACQQSRGTEGQTDNP